MAFDFLGAGLVELLFADVHQLDLLIGGQGVVDLVDLPLKGLQDLIRGHTFRSLGVGINGSGEFDVIGEHAVGGAGHQNFLDHGDGRDQLLQLFGGDIFAVFKDDQIAALNFFFCVSFMRGKRSCGDSRIIRYN